VAHVLSIDRFGNVALNISHEDLPGTGIVLGGQVEISTLTDRYLAQVTHTFADVKAGEIVLYEDSYRALSIAINRGDAAATLQIGRDAEVRITPR
jgi:S-adenosylmethionine hydrolase